MIEFKSKLILLLLISGILNCVFAFEKECSLLEHFKSVVSRSNVDQEAPIGKIPIDTNNKIYIIYDVNLGEGFNLRRDVYIRMAVFIHNLRKKTSFENVKLVLPPFPRLYHWQSSHIDQDKVWWNHFFDMNSLRLFAPVLDFYEFIDELQLNKSVATVDRIIQLQHFEEMFTNGVFFDKFEFSRCTKSNLYSLPLFGYRNVTENEFICLKFQGSSSLLEQPLQIVLKKIMSSPKSIAFLNAEIVLHDHWGDNQFWQARRSMRFNQNLVKIANAFRKEVFNSSDELDLVQRPNDWTKEKKYRGAKGGEYLCAHLRRADFLYGHEKTTPTLKSAANQIRFKLRELKLNKVFISSDCTKFEYKNLKSYLGRAKTYRFSPESLEQKEQIKDGGQAIIDQLICANAKYFIGTYESTFTYRIYEEREILGFPKETTFNTFCKNEDLTDCERNTIWPIVY